MIELSAEQHEELVARLTALRALAEGLADAYDDPTAAAGAREMLGSIDRMLELVGAAQPSE